MLLNNIRKNFVWIPSLLLPYLLMFIISGTLMEDVYLPKWTAHNLYYYNWLFVVLFAALDKKHLAAAVSLGNIVGIAAGQIVGDIILNKNADSIIPAMDEGLKHMLRIHYGVPIWLITIFLVFIIFAVYNFGRTYKKI